MLYKDDVVGTGPFSKSRIGLAGKVSPLSCGSVASMKDAISA